MKCPQCQSENPAGMKFCGECGSKFKPACPQCGAEALPGFKFCGECGSPLAASTSPASPPRPEPVQRPAAAAAQSYTPQHLAEQVLQSKSALEGERKQVTVLFCDLVSSTAMADRIGPEAMHQLLNRFFELALGEIHRYKGTINQFLGDGFMALFGAPIALEDHPLRAVLAAVGLQKRMQEDRSELGESLGDELAIRMGVNTGWVVVGGIGDHLRMDYTAVGDTTNLAARLQAAAEPGSVLISDTTSRIVQGSVLLEALPPFLVKGKANPIHAFKVLGIGAGSEQTILGGGVLSPLVGRERELTSLYELRDQADNGEGQVIGISGEAGSGKSRLLYEFCRSTPAVYLTGRCLSYGGGVPYLPLLYMIRNHLGISEAESPQAVSSKIQAGLEKVGINPEEAAPYLLHLLAIKEGTGHLAALSPQAVQTRTFAILRQMLLNAGCGRLVVLEIEDLHWIDETSEEFLAFLIEGQSVSRMLVLLTYRSGYQPRWMDKSYATQMSMRRLTARDSQSLIDAVLRRSKLPENLARIVLEKAEGNPFFLEELTRSILEDSSWSDVAVPDTIQGVLMARIDRLPEEHKRLLQTASVLGREFTPDLLMAICEQPGTAMPLLADLKKWEFLYESPGLEKPVYFFKHALTQEAVYQSLLMGRRQTLHLAAGRALEVLYADHLVDIYDSLIYHFPKGGDAEKSVKYLSLFARRAARGYAHAEAAKALLEAIKHAERLPAERKDRAVVEMILQLAESLLPLARFSDTLELFLQHVDTLARVGDPSLAGRYFFWLAHTYSYLGNREEAARSAQRATEAARLCGDEGIEGKASYVLSRDGFWSGQFAEGIEHSLRAVALLEGSEDRWWQGQAYWVSGFNLFALGRFEEALQAMARVRSIWRTLADPRLDASWSDGYFHACLGAWDRGIEECLGGLERAQDPLNTAAALGFLGYAYLEKRDLPNAVRVLEDSVQRTKQAGIQPLLGWFSVFLGEAYAYSGRLDEAEALAAQALAVTSEVGFGYGIGFAQRALGRVAWKREDGDQARRRLEQAAAQFQGLGIDFEVARTQLDLAALASCEGRTGEATELLAEARNTFLDLAVPAYVERADRAVEEGLSAPLRFPRAKSAGMG